jgi:hypothetical protein
VCFVPFPSAAVLFLSGTTVAHGTEKVCLKKYGVKRQTKAKRSRLNERARRPTAARQPLALSHRW